MDRKLLFLHVIYGVHGTSLEASSILPYMLLLLHFSLVFLSNISLC